MRRMFLVELRGDEATVDGRWTLKQRNQVEPGGVSIGEAIEGSGGWPAALRRMWG